MNHEEEYERKLANAEDAVRVVKSGDWVDYGHFTCGPPISMRRLPGGPPSSATSRSVRSPSRAPWP